MIVHLHEGQVMLVDAPAGSKVYRPVPALYDLVGGAELEELLKVPDGGGGFHRIPLSLVAEAARKGLYGLRALLAEVGGPQDRRQYPA